ncbi:unnamed protein product [Calypogeia fissa]
MSGSGVRSSSLIPKLSILENNRSIRRSLISPGDSPLSARKVSPPTELPVLSSPSGGGGRKSTTPIESPLRIKVFIDDHSFRCSSLLCWCACFLIVTLVIMTVLGTHPVCNALKTANSSPCSGAPLLSTSSHGDELPLLPPVDEHHSQDDTFGGEDDTVEYQSQDDKFGGDNNIVEHQSQDDKLGGDDEMEDEKCWSRTRHWKYRPSSRHFPPSPALTRALQNYESLHARCTDGKRWESLTDLTQSDDNDDSSPCKYVIYVDGWEGLGNRFMSLVSAFAYALMTDRVLLVDTRRNMSGLICEPFEKLSWNLPLTFPYDDVYDLPSLDDMVNNDLEGEDALSLNLRHEQTERDQSFFCPDMQERLGKVAVIGWNSNQYYIPRFYMMPEFWPKLNTLFDNPSVAFTQLSRVLLLPQNGIWAKVERIYRAYLATSKNLVGLQVRSPHSDSFERTIFDRIVHCLTYDNHVLPKIGKKPLPLDMESSRENGLTIFVASLQRGYYEQLKADYAENGAENGTLVTVYTMAAEGQEDRTYDQSVSAFIDIMLLSFSDSLGTSAWSTFGYVAQGLGAVHPHIVTTDTALPDSCNRGQSIEPCCQYPMLSMCPAASMTDSSEHGEWIKKHIRSCQDHHTGIQLVSS